MDKDEQRQVVNDASDKVKGFLYQFYVALNYCFELKQGEKLYIEKYGDVTIDSISQIEVKNYSKPLTDAHDNFWNTLCNWLNDSFDPNNYKQLILLTTQQIGTNSQLNNWNKKTKAEKITTITSIADAYCKKNSNPKSSHIESIKKHMETVISADKREKLEAILEKFTIIDCALGFEEIYESMKTKYARHIPECNQDDYLNSLLGFVLNPKIVDGNWEITYENFTKTVRELTSVYHEKAITFPKIQRNFSQEEIDKKKTARFVKKIEDIEYDESMKRVAIDNYLYTSNLFLNELANYKMSPDIMSNYESELMDSYNPKRRKHCRNLLPNAKHTDIINESQNFYDDVVGEPAQAFVIFNDTPKRFRNGFYHIMADEDDDKIVWLLKKESNDDKTI